MRYLDMNKAEFIDAVASKSELTKQDAKKVIKLIGSIKSQFFLNTLIKKTP